jgi:hypothetical protein
MPMPGASATNPLSPGASPNPAIPGTSPPVPAEAHPIRQLFAGTIMAVLSGVTGGVAAGVVQGVTGSITSWFDRKHSAGAGAYPGYNSGYGASSYSNYPQFGSGTYAQGTYPPSVGTSSYSPSVGTNTTPYGQSGYGTPSSGPTTYGSTGYGQTTYGQTYSPSTYPPGSTTYPPVNSTYPPTNSPQVASTYPPPSSTYPPINSAYPPTSSPQVASSYPPTPTYPQTTTGYPGATSAPATTPYAGPTYSSGSPPSAQSSYAPAAGVPGGTPPQAGSYGSSPGVTGSSQGAGSSANAFTGSGGSALVQVVDPRTGQSAGPAVVPSVSGSGSPTLYAGFAYEVHALSSGQADVPVDAATYQFHTGDQFKVYFRPSMPGHLEVYNVNPLGQQTLIDSAKVAAGQLTVLGPYAFAANKGDESLRLVLSPCSEPQLLASTRDIVNVSPSPGTSGIKLPECTATRSVSVTTRDIQKVAVDGSTSFALDGVAASELSTGQIAARSVSIYFHHL